MPALPAKHPDDEPLIDEAVNRAAALDDFLGGFADSAPAVEAGGPAGGPLSGDEDADLVDVILLLRQAAAADGVAPAVATAMPRTIGRHAILRLAGEGGFATVWEGFDTLLRRPVAVKVRRPEMLLSESARRRFVREAEIAARLVHPHIVTVYEVGEDSGREFIASEYCAGGNLAAWLERHPGPLPPRTAARLVRAIAGAVACAHDAGVVHRDIKPANVLLAAVPRGIEPILDADGPRGEAARGLTVKLGDFGLGAAREDVDDADPLTHLTRTGTTIGTPAWMAPEQIDSSFGPVGPATDVHGLGLLLDRLLTGRALRGGGTDAETYRQVLLDEPVPADRIVRDVPPDLAAVAATCVVKRPEERYATAAALADDLDRWLDGRPTLARPLTTAGSVARWIRRRPVVAALAAAAMIASVLAVWAGAERGRERQAVVRHQDELRRQSAAAELRRGFESLRAGNVAGAMGHLDKTRSIDPALADSMAGRWLARRMHGEREILLSPAAGASEPAPKPRDLYAIALAADGTAAGVAGADGRVRLLRNLAGPAAVTMTAAHDEVNAVAFSPDGTQLATAGQDGRLRWWRLTDAGLEAAGAAEPGRPLYAAAFAPDGRSIATGGEDRVVRIVTLDSPASPVALFEFEPPPGRSPDVESLVFVDDGRLAAACGDQIVLLDAATGRIILEFERPEEHNRTAVLGGLKVSRDGRRIAACGTTSRAHVWDLATGRIVSSIPPHPAWVQGCCFLDDDQRLVTACRDGVIRIFDLETARELTRLAGHAGRVWSVVAEPGGTLLTCGADGTVRRWDPTRAFETSALRGLPGGPNHILRLAEGPCDRGSERSVIAVDSTGIVWQIDVATGSRTTLGPAPPRAFEIDLDSSRRRVAIGWRDGETIDVLELGSPDPPQQVPLPAGFDPRQALVTWSPGGDLVVCSRNGSLCTISSDLTHAMRIAAPLRDPVQKVAVAPVDPPRVAAAGGHSAIVPLPGGFATGRPSPPLPLDVGEEGSSVAWSPDATLIACGTRSGRVVLFDGATGAVHGTLVPHERDALAVAFSRDGRILVSADPGCVRISDVATLTTLDEIRPDWHVKVLRLTDDDRCLVLGGHSLDAAAHGGRLAVMDLDRP